MTAYTVYSRCNNKLTYHNENKRYSNIAHLAVPHGVLQGTGRLLELKCLLVQSISLIHKQLNSLASLQHPIDVLDHDVFHAVYLSLYLRDVV